MDNVYTYEKKKKLADKIGKLKKKEDMLHILNIIYDKNKNITENQNGLFMLFDKLDDETYTKIDNYLRTLIKKKAQCDLTISDTSFTDSQSVQSTEKSNTDLQKSDSPNSKIDQQKKIFEKPDFAYYKYTDEHFSPNIKYSNREKNIIKRQVFDKQLENANKNESIIYTKFDATIISESETESDKNVQTINTINNKNPINKKKASAKKSANQHYLKKN